MKLLRIIVIIAALTTMSALFAAAQRIEYEYNEFGECVLIKSDACQRDVYEANAAEQNAAETKVISIRPNPVTDYLDIELNQKDDTETFTMTVCDITGRKVQNFTCSDSHMTIDFSNYASGIYIIKVTDKSSTEIHKVVKK